LAKCFVAFIKIVIASNITLLEGFWPSSNWRSNYAKASLSTMMDVVDSEDSIQLPYYGPNNMKPLTTYTI